MKISEVIANLQKRNQDEIICMTLWGRDDILFVADQMEMELSEDQINCVLMEMERYNYSDRPISLDTIGCLLGNLE